jgi:WD40 repeat protein
MKKFFLLSLATMLSFIVHGQTLQWTALANPDSMQVNAVSFATNDSKIVSATNCHPAHVRKLNSNNGLVEWDYIVPSSLMCIMGVGISSDNKYLAAVEEMGNIIIFDNTTPTPDSINLISMGTSYAFSMHISPHSLNMVVGASNGKLQCYRIADGAQLFNVNAHSSWVTSVQYSSDNSIIASGGNDNKIKIWDSAGNLIYTLNGHTDDITSLRFSSTNDTLWSSSLDNTIRMWDVNTSNLLQTHTVSNADINAMDYNFANRILVTVSKDKWIRIFDARNLQIKDSLLQAHDVVPTAIASDKSGNSIVSGTINGLITKYDVSAVLSAPNHLLNNKLFVAYPNPCSNGIYIKSEAHLKHFTILDVMGKKILEGNLDTQNKIDFTNIPPGNYFLSAIDEDNIVYHHKITIR